MLWTGEARGNERVTSYSGRPILDVYMEVLDEKDWNRTHFYVQKMNRDELVEGSRKTLAWLLKDPKRTDVTNGGRMGVFFYTAVGPFFQAYSRSFAKEGKAIDPSPFRAMLADKSLDVDFRRALADCYGDPDFYTTSWEQLNKDAAALGQLARDATEDERIRSRASSALFRLSAGLFNKYYRETIQDKLPHGGGNPRSTDLVAMLDQKPCPFSPAEKARLEQIVRVMDQFALDTLKLLDESKKQSTRFWGLTTLNWAQECHLLRNKESLKRIQKIIAEEKANEGGH
ncbi:MAG: hypothetical protein JW818_12785 [Pirellulales bacterium]|nr:hypothetical protein [Pirellulales bacterium]